MLSANKQANIYIEALLDSTDFNSNIDRATFEKISEDIFSRILNPVEALLVKTGRTLADVTTLEIVGAGVRVPRVQQILSQFMGGIEIAAHINGDEAIALGAGFRAANLSSSFKTKTIYLNDGFEFDIYVHIKNLNESVLKEDGTPFEKSAKLFPVKSRFGTRKTVTFHHDEDLFVEFYFINQAGQNETIVQFNVTGINGIRHVRLYLNSRVNYLLER